MAIGLATKAAFASKGVPEPSFLSHPLFTLLQTSTHGFSSAGDGEDESLAVLRAALAAVKSVEEAAVLIAETLISRLAGIMALNKDDIDPGKPVHYYGVDSLVAVELRSWLSKHLGADIEVLDIMGDGSIAQLADMVARSSKLLTFASEPSADD